MRMNLMDIADILHLKSVINSWHRTCRTWMVGFIRYLKTLIHLA